ncbi:hypothetical protein D3C77_548500 [compost metagenome]
MPTDNKPFLYNGTTYVPLSFIAQALGQQVKWDSNTKTVLIGESEGENELYLDKDIKHMNVQKGYIAKWNYEYNSNAGIKDNIGNEYANYLSMYVDSVGKDRSWEYIEFPLNGNIKSLKGKVGLTDKYKSTTEEIKVTILADDKSVYTHTFKAGDFPEDINVDLKGALKVQFKVQGLNDAGYGASYEIGLFNPIFYK